MHETYTPFKLFFCGGVGRLFSITFGYPLDTIKVRLQTMPLPAPGEPPIYTGMVDCFIKIIKNEGFRSLFRGITAPLIISVPQYSIVFFSYGVGKQIVNKDENTPSMPKLFIAGSFAASIGALLITPAEHIKILLQLKKNSSTFKYKGTIDCLKQLYAQGGMKYVYKGTSVTLFRDIPATGVFFMTYDSIKSFICERADASYRVVLSVLSGGLAGMSFWIIAMPADVLKTKIQSAPKGKYKGLMDAFKQLTVTEGPRGLYTGVIPVMLRAFLVNTIYFLGFEIGIKLYDAAFVDL